MTYVYMSFGHVTEFHMGSAVGILTLSVDCQAEQTRLRQKKKQQKKTVFDLFFIYWRKF